MNSWVSILTTGICTIGFILSAFLLFMRKPLSSKLLGWYTLALVIGIAEPLILNFELSPALIALYGGFSFFYGPLLYLYVSYATSGLREFAVKDLRHFIPASIYFLLVVALPAGNSGKQEEDALTEIILYELLFYQIFYYTLKAIIRWAQFRMAGGSDQIMQMKIAFIKNLLIFSALLFVSSFLFVHVFLLARAIPFPPVFYIYIQLTFTFLILMIALLNTEMIQPGRAPV
jgi:hypothetical protein